MFVTHSLPLSTSYYNYHDQDANIQKKAIQAWKTPLYAPHYHQTGFLHLTSGTAPEKARATLSRFFATIRKHPQYQGQSQLIDIASREDIRDIAWQYDGAFPGWKGYFNRQAGYAHAANALLTVYKAAAAKGVKFFLGGERGHVTELVYDQSQRQSQDEGQGHGQGRKVTGVRTRGGAVVPATLTIVAVGAAAATLVPSAGAQVVAKSWSLAHVRLSDEETSALRGVPVTYARDLGFFFEPDPKTNLLKICPMGGGYVNTDAESGRSLPPATMAESDVLPTEDEGRIRRLLRETMPALAGRPLVGKRLCWFADTKDSDFIVDYVPGTAGSVVVLSGDSGHLFKMLPLTGQWVHRLLVEGRQSIARWQWKDGEEQKGKWEGDVSWRLGETREFAEVRKISKL